MKELSIEEKARAYDEALERAKGYHTPETHANLRIAMENLFPELKESEEERIRKEIIEDYRCVKRLCREGEEGSKRILDEKIAWLEKQGEQKTVDEIAKEVCKNKESAIAFLKSAGIMNEKGELAEQYRQEGQKPAEEYNITGIRSKNAQGKLGEMIKKLKPVNEVLEQNSANKVEPKFNKGDILYEQKTMSILLVYERNGSWLMTFCDYWMLKEKFHVEFPYEKYGFVQEMSLVPATKEQRDLLFKKMHEAGYEWDADKKELKKKEVDNLHNYLYCEYNPTWSEEDSIMARDIDYALRCQITYPISRLQSMSTWINNLKDRVQPKQEWNEEDERKKNKLIWIFEEIKKGANYFYGSDVKETIDWLKSLRPQPTWKPSKEQIMALRWVLNHIPYDSHKEEISGLLDQIKEL